jgi:hypothetical protein
MSEHARHSGLLSFDRLIFVDIQGSAVEQGAGLTQ